MKDLKKYSNKTKAAFVLLIVMFIILLSNFNTLQNSKKTNEDINTIYNDRLVVARYIFQYGNELYFIKTNAVDTKLNDTQKKDKITAALKNIQNIDKLYLKTVLTPKEKTSLAAFLTSCSTINKEAQNKNWSQVNNSSNQALQTLEQLSKIQSEEGKSKLTHSNTLHNDNNSMGQLQIALLVILGGITLYLLLSKKNKISIKIPESHSLN
jgi:MFS superfamily sulfate permease-like transporter